MKQPCLIQQIGWMVLDKKKKAWMRWDSGERKKRRYREDDGEAEIWGAIRWPQCNTKGRAALGKIISDRYKSLAAAHGICGTHSSSLIDLANIKPGGLWVVTLKEPHCLSNWKWKARIGHVEWAKKCRALPRPRLLSEFTHPFWSGGISK